MDFELSSEQTTLREISRQVLGKHCSSEQVRALADQDQDVPGELWRAGSELGWTGLAVPEQHGGAGQGLVELCLAAEEIGRAAAPGPFLPTALVGLAVARYGAVDLQDTVLSDLAEATTSATWALAEPGGSWHPRSVRTEAVRDRGEIRLNGRKVAVQDAGSATWLLVTAVLDGAPVSVLVPGSADGIALREQRTLDRTRSFYEVRFSDVRVPAQRGLLAATAEHDRLCEIGAVLTAADALGAGERLLEMTVDYAKVREQFGRAIGSFQAVKHKCADMLIATQAARATTYHAAMAIAADDSGAPRAASAAKATTCERMSRLAGEALQTHGGIGFTWEHDLHLYLRRVKADETLHGSPEAHHERLCSLLLIGRP